MSAVMPSGLLHLLWRVVRKEWQQAKKGAEVIVKYVPTETVVEIATTPTTPAPMSPPLLSLSWIILAVWLFCVVITYFSALPTRLASTAATNALHRQIDELEKEVATLKVQLAQTALSNAAEIGEIVRANDDNVTTLMSQHQSQLSSMSMAHGNDISTLKGQHQEQLSSLVVAHGKEISALKDQHQHQLSSMSSAHDKEISTLKTELELQEMRLTSKLDRSLFDLDRATKASLKKERKAHADEILELESEIEYLRTDRGPDGQIIRTLKEDHAKETAKLTAKIGELRKKIQEDCQAFAIKRAEYTTAEGVAIKYAQIQAQSAKDEVRSLERFAKYWETQVDEWKSHWKTAKEEDNKRQAKAASDKVVQGRKIAKLTKKLKFSTKFATKQITTMAKQAASQKLVEENLRKELGRLHAAISAKEQATAQAELAAAKPPVRSRRGMPKESSGQVTARKTSKAPESADAMSKLTEDHVAKKAHSAGILKTTREGASKAQQECAQAKQEAAQADARATAALEQLSVAQRRLEEVLAEASALKESSEASKAESEMQLEQSRREAADSKAALEAAKGGLEAAQILKTMGEGASKAQQESAQAKHEAAQADARATEALEQLSVAQRRLEEVRAEALAVKTSSEASKAESEMQLEQSRRETADSKGALEAAKGEVEAAKGGLEAARGELAAARREFLATKQKLIFWESQATVTAAEKEAIKGELDITKSFLEMAQREGNQLLVQGQRLQDGQDLAVQRVDEAYQTLDQTKMALEQSERRVAELLKEGNAITEQLQALRQEHHALQEEHAAMGTKASENLMHADNAKEELAKLREECTDVKNKNSMLLTQLARKAPPQQAADTDSQMHDAVNPQQRQQQQQRAVNTVISARRQPVTLFREDRPAQKAPPQQATRKAPPQQAADTDSQMQDAVTPQQRQQEQRAVSTVISALPQPATLSEMPDAWFADPELEATLRAFEKENLGGGQGTISMFDDGLDNLDRELIDALTEELARDELAKNGQSQSVPNPPPPPTAASTPGPPSVKIFTSSHLVKSAPKVQPRAGGYRRSGRIAGSSNSQPQTPSPKPPAPFALPGVPPTRPIRSFVFPSPPKQSGPFVFPSIPPATAPLPKPSGLSGKGKDDGDDDWEIPKFSDLPTNCEWYSEKPSGWKPDMTEGKERNLRLNGRMNQLRMMEAEGFDVKARMANVEKEVESALRQWRAQPAAPDATVKLVGDQLVYVDNTDYGSLGIRPRDPTERDKDIAAFDTSLYSPPKEITPEEQAMIDARTKVAPKSRRPQPPPPPPPPAPET